MDIGPGDLVRCVDASVHAQAWVGALVEGRVYRIAECFPAGGVTRYRGQSFSPSEDGVRLEGDLLPYPYAWALTRFRKLPDISEWLETSTEYEEPRRVPAPREVEGV